MLEEKVLKTIRKYELIKNGDNIVVGVSGGPDSMTLLNALLNLKKNKIFDIKICVAHINHGLREEADAETKYVEDFCLNNNIECFIKKENVKLLAEKNKVGTEEAGRNLRYSFFEEVLNKVGGNKIATAHNSNDNAETVLMNIIRGSGTAGLKGIEPIRDNKYIRPLIDCLRREIEEYCLNENLNPKIDKTNMENDYTRNKVRNLLIPYIEENYNPNIISSLNKLSEISTLENEFIENIVKENYSALIIGEELGNKAILDLKGFNKLDTVIKNRIMLYTISRVIGSSQNIEKTNIEDLVKLCKNNVGNKYLTPNKNIKILVDKRKNFF